MGKNINKRVRSLVNNTEGLEILSRLRTGQEFWPKKICKEITGKRRKALAEGRNMHDHPIGLDLQSVGQFLPFARSYIKQTKALGGNC